MSRTLLAWCCAALSCFPSPARPMTVSPIVFPASSTPSPSDPGDHQHHHHRRHQHGAGTHGPYDTAAAYGYGHRTWPESGGARVRVGRDGPRHALYESPHTYEYMTDPRKGGRLRQDGSAVPKTERRPPGDDVEYLTDARPPPAKDRRRYGHGGQRQHGNAGGRYYDAGDDDDDDGRGGERTRKRKRKSPPAGGRAVEPEAGSTSKSNVRKDAAKVRDNGERPVYEKKTRAKKNGAKGVTGAGNGVKKFRDREEVVGGLDAPVKHKIHKKNEYSKKQQFFDEQHVDHGKKKPTLNRDRNKKGQKKRASHDNASKKRKRRVMKDTNKDRGNFEHVKQKSSQGYGQILAVR